MQAIGLNLTFFADGRTCGWSCHSPQTRYSFKYRNVDGTLVLKVTDDKTVRSFISSSRATCCASRDVSL
jgi:hypothetical protein